MGSPFGCTFILICPVLVFKKTSSSLHFESSNSPSKTIATYQHSLLLLEWYFFVSSKIRLPGISTLTSSMSFSNAISSRWNHYCINGICLKNMAIFQLRAAINLSSIFMQATLPTIAKIDSFAAMTFSYLGLCCAIARSPKDSPTLITFSTSMSSISLIFSLSMSRPSWTTLICSSILV